MKALYVMNHESFELVYPSAIRSQIEKLVQIVSPPMSKDELMKDLSILHDIDIIISSWGAPTFDEKLLQAAPNLKAVFYGAGSIKNFVTDAFWERDILITSAYAANAVPVAEFTLAQIIFSLKKGWYWSQQAKQGRRRDVTMEIPGLYKSTVGIISLGMIGRMVCEHLKRFDLNVIAYDPFATEETASELNVKLVSLEEIFEQSDVVSLHTPWLKETEGMITGKLFASMKKNATFINTSRGAIVREDEMIEVLKQRPDLYSVLDVTYPEPPLPDSPLYSLPNVILTPHIAGSVTNECARMGEYVIEEIKRFLDGKEPVWPISQKQSKTMA